VTHKVSKYCEVFVHHCRSLYTSRAAVYVHRVSQALYIAGHRITQALYCGPPSPQAIYIRPAYMHCVLCIVRVYHMILDISCVCVYDGLVDELGSRQALTCLRVQPSSANSFPQGCGKTLMICDISYCNIIINI